MVKQFKDGERFILTIEPTDEKEKELIKAVSKLCGFEGETPRTFENVLPPPIPTVKEEPKKEESDGVGAGYKAYLETVRKLRNKELTGDARKEALEKVKKTAEALKTRIPKGANLRFCIENMSEIFSERIENTVLDEMHISKEQLVLGDGNLMTEAYKKAIAVPPPKK